MDIGEVIFNIRNKNGISQQEFAEMFYKSQRFVSDIERGRQEPDIDFLNQVACKYNSPVLKAYICGHHEAQLIESAVEHCINHYIETGHKTYLFA